MGEILGEERSMKMTGEVIILKKRFEDTEANIIHELYA